MDLPGALWNLWVRRLRFEYLGPGCTFGRGTEFQNQELIDLVGQFSCGRNCLLSGDVTIGMNVHLNNNVQLNAANDGYIEIGNDVLIGPNVVVRAANHGIARQQHIVDQKHKRGYIVILDDVWIGANAVILPNVTIGPCAVVGAGAVVTKNVERFAIVAGVPAIKIGERK